MESLLVFILTVAVAGAIVWWATSAQPARGSEEELARAGLQPPEGDHIAATPLAEAPDTAVAEWARAEADGQDGGKAPEGTSNADEAAGVVESAPGGWPGSRVAAGGGTAPGAAFVPASGGPALRAVPAEGVEAASPARGWLRLLRPRHAAAADGFEVRRVPQQGSFAFEPVVEVDERHPILAFVGIVLSIIVVAAAIAGGIWFVGHYVNQQIVQLVGQ